MRKIPAFLIATASFLPLNLPAPGWAAEHITGDWRGKVFESGQGCEMTLDDVSATTEKSKLTLRFHRGAQEFSTTLNLKNGRFSEWHDLDVFAALESEGRAGLGAAPIRMLLRSQGGIENNLLSGSFESSRNTGDTDLSTGPNCAASFKLAPAGSSESDAIRTGKPIALIALEHRLIGAGLLPPSSETPPAAEPVEGPWSGKITETGNGCSLSLTGISAILEGDKFNLKLQRGDEEIINELSIKDRAFSEWKDVEVTASIDTDFGANTGDARHRLPLLFKGAWKDGRIDGSYRTSTLRSGAPGRATCVADFTLAPERSVEAEAIITGKPAYLIALRRRVVEANPHLASRLRPVMDDRFPPAATETLDGEWVGKFTENGEGCKLSLSGITATVRANMLTLRLLRGEHEATADIELNNGKFSAWNDLTMVANIVSDFGADVGDQRHRRPFQLSGKFDRKRMTGFLHSPT
ncbi:MAG: hypothetical protein O3A84_08305, partial [Proteobacteria bacterium]|nr:hypothetical protein [Pseudomonadota bacterium]